MSVKTSADVLIGGKIYTLSGYESEEYLQKVANYINNKINEFDEMEQFRRIPVDMKATLLELNIADDYFKAKEQAEMLEKTVREKEKEIYELQHDLISANIKVESSEETAANLEKENKELLLNKAKLETSLADALLGKVKGQVPAEHAEQPQHQTDKHEEPRETDSPVHVTEQGGNKKHNSNKKR
ncbi:MAG: cell division protein ZapA [Lachnospiraceae bacterium]|nr:cell division protein ZapA [Lachnospiraceae bacterium]